MVIDRPRIQSTRDVSRWRRDDVTAAGAHIDAAPEWRVVHRLCGDIDDVGAVRRGKQHVLATATGERPPGRWHLAVLALERTKAFIAVVPWIDIDDDQAVGDDAKVRLRQSSRPTESNLRA